MHNHRFSIPTPSLIFALSVFTLALCVVGQPGAWAQTPSVSDPAAATRAAREADSPLRVIIEASKLKVRTKPDGEAIDGRAPEKRVAPRPAASRGAAPAPNSATAAASPLARPAASAALASPELAVAKLTEAPPANPATSAAVALPPKAEPLPLVPLKLAQMVEPSLPGNVLRRLRADVEVVVGFTVNADGSVSDVAVRSSPMKLLDAPVVEAISQWRYEPIREARAHAVQLVLRAAP